METQIGNKRATFFWIFFEFLGSANEGGRIEAKGRDQRRVEQRGGATQRNSPGHPTVAHLHPFPTVAVQAGRAETLSLIVRPHTSCDHEQSAAFRSRRMAPADV